MPLSFLPSLSLSSLSSLSSIPQRQTNSSTLDDLDENDDIENPYHKQKASQHLIPLNPSYLETNFSENTNNINDINDTNNNINNNINSITNNVTNNSKDNIITNNITINNINDTKSITNNVTNTINSKDNIITNNTNMNISFKLESSIHPTHETIDKNINNIDKINEPYNNDRIIVVDKIVDIDSEKKLQNSDSNFIELIKLTDSPNKDYKQFDHSLISVIKDPLHKSFGINPNFSNLNPETQKENKSQFNDNMFEMHKINFQQDSDKLLTSSYQTENFAFNQSKKNIFILENTTNYSIYFATKSLPLKFVNFPLHDHQHQVLQEVQPSPPRRHVLSGPNAWNNLVRYEIGPKDYVHAIIPPRRTALSLLFVEFRKEKIISQTATHENFKFSQIDSKLSYDKDQKQIKLNEPQKLKNDLKLKKTLINNENLKSSNAHNEQYDERVFRSYWIEIEPKTNTDIILRVRIEKTLFGMKRYIVEPVSFWFGGEYNVCDCKSGPIISLKNNITKRQLFPVVKLHDKSDNDSKKEKNPLIPLPSSTRIPPTSSFSPDASMSVCEEESLATLRENIVTQMTFLKRMKRKLRILVIRDKKQDFDPINYMVQHVVRINSTQIRKWFSNCIELLEIEASQMEDYLIIPMKFSRCLNVYNKKYWKISSTQAEIEPLYSRISGVILLWSVNSCINSTLKPLMQRLEGFPLLFMLYGLLECNTIYDALQRKEIVEMDIVKLFSSTHKPLIVSCIEKKTETENLTTCTFLRECIDSEVEKCVSEVPIEDSIFQMEKIEEIISGLLRIDSNQKRSELAENDDNYFIQKKKLRSSFYLLSVDNEYESINSVIESMPHEILSNHDIIICAQSRELFSNPQMLFTKSTSGKQIAEQLSTTIRRNMSTLWNFGDSSDEESEEVNETPFRRVKSGSQLNTLDISTKIEDEGLDKLNLNSNCSTDGFIEQLSDNSYTKTQKDLEASILDSTLEDSLNSQNNYSITPKKSISHLHNNDCIVLCVELSGRVLISGSNGIFSNFLSEARTRTPNICLIVDRRDREGPSEYQNISESRIFEDSYSIVCGDNEDYLLDNELKNSQFIHEYCPFRCYLSSRNIGERIQEFWSKVLSRLN